MTDIPLGKDSPWPDEYAPDVLFPIPRAEARAPLGLSDPLPFSGADVWNAWELTWLDAADKPVVATAAIVVPADSSHIVESKSLKLYLNSFAQSRYASAGDVRVTIASDIANIVAADVDVRLDAPADWAKRAVVELPGTLIDDMDTDCSASDVDPALLETGGQDTVEETLHSHLLRSLCPVTNQPDMGSIVVRYRGRRIKPERLLRYIVSFRQHNDFHEACVERMFVDIKARCGCEALTVHARYNRRGGIDINPFRTDFGQAPDNPRLWRQ